MIYKRKDSGFWWYSFTVNGKVTKKSTGRPLADKKAAMRVAAQAYEKALNAHQFGERPEMSLGEASEKILKTVSGRTQESYNLSGRKWTGKGDFSKLWHLTPDTPLSEITNSTLVEHRTARAEEGLKANSINLEVRYIQRLYNLARTEWEVSVREGVKFVQLSGFEKSRHLTDEEDKEVDRVLTTAGGESRAKALTLKAFILSTGVRLNEALNIRWPQVNLSEGYAEIYRTKTSGLSLVPLTDDALSHLRKVHNQPQPFMEMSRAVRLLRSTIDKVCNLDPVIIETRGAATIHSLRDTFATRLAQDGMSIASISNLLGHTTLTQTQKYAHYDSAKLVQEAKERLRKRA